MEPQTTEYLTQAELHSELFNLLCVFDEFMKELGLRYSLDAGTLLGAVRHEGFIPWDDDLDVMMPRPDYEELLRNKDLVPEGYALMGYKADGTPFPFLKFSNLSVRMEEEIIGGAHDEFLWIDIFPVDGMYEDEEQNDLVYEKIRKLIYARMFQTYPSASPILNLVKKPLQAAMNVARPMSKIMEEFSSLAQGVPFDSSTWCRDIVWANNPKARFRTSDFDNMDTVTFCGKQFPAIDNWDAYLTSQYGNYMELPPVEKRTAHAAKAWRV